MKARDLADRLDDVEISGGVYSARCRANPKARLALYDGDAGLRLVCDDPACSPEAVAVALGVSVDELLTRDTSEPPAEGAAPGLTLAQYSAAKCLPEHFLRQLGLADLTYSGEPAVRIPYFDVAGQEVAVRFRLSLDGPFRFVWRKGAKPVPYGLWHLQDAREAGYLIIPEGESDTQTLWWHSRPALGLPGNGTWREEWAQLLDDIPLIFVVIEPASSGEGMLKWVARSEIRHRVRLVRLAEHKDPSALWIADPDRQRFNARLDAALHAGLTWGEHERRERERQAAVLRERCESLACHPRVLDRLAADLHERGLVSESRAAKLLFVTKLSVDVLGRAVSAVVKGPSSAGKNFVTDNVLAFFVPESYSALSSLSERALIYDDEPLDHRTLVLYEQAGLDGDFVSYIVRSLLSEGRVQYKTVEKGSDGKHHTRTIVREGPTNLITTTTRIHVDRETETRLVSIPINDSPAQTQEILQGQAAEAEGVERQPVDLAVWRALHGWLRLAEHRVVIPFAGRLARLIPPAAVRLRRDFPTLLALIKTHAILQQLGRERDARGRVVATLEDYAVVRDLVADLLAETVQVEVPATIRETVEAVRVLRREGIQPEHLSVRRVARHLGLDESAAWRRIQAAIREGYLRNLEPRKYLTAKLDLDVPPPEEHACQELLPAAEDPRLQLCTGNGGDTSPSPPWAAEDTCSSPQEGGRRCSSSQNEANTQTGSEVPDRAGEKTLADRPTLPRKRPPSPSPPSATTERQASTPKKQPVRDLEPEQPRKQPARHLELEHPKKQPVRDLDPPRSGRKFPVR